MLTQTEDTEILSLFGAEQTKNKAFNLLLKKYQQKIYWHVRRMVIDHEDAVDIAPLLSNKRILREHYFYITI